MPSSILRAECFFFYFVIFFGMPIKVNAEVLSISVEEIRIDLQPFGARDAKLSRSHGFHASAYLKQDERSLRIRLDVVSKDSKFQELEKRHDHFLLRIFAPPNPYTDSPSRHFYSEYLDAWYFFPEERIEEIAESGGLSLIDHTWPGPDGCVVDLPELGFMQQRNRRLGVFELRFDPYYGRFTAVEEVEHSAISADIAKNIDVEQVEISEKGYSVIFSLSPKTMGLLPVQGVSGLRFSIEAVSGEEKLVSYTQGGQPFSTLRFSQPLNFPLPQGLEFLAMPKADMPEIRKRLAAASPPYLLFSDSAWWGAYIGSRPEEDVYGNDFCSDAIMRNFRDREAFLVARDLGYSSETLNGLTVEHYRGSVYLNGEYVFTPEGEIVDTFVLSESGVGFIHRYSLPERGRFARGPCAAGNSHFEDLVIADAGNTWTYNLTSVSDCHGWPKVAGTTIQSEDGVVGFPKGVEFDASDQALHLAVNEYLFSWRPLWDGASWVLETEKAKVTGSPELLLGELVQWVREAGEQGREAKQVVREVMEHFGEDRTEPWLTNFLVQAVEEDLSLTTISRILTSHHGQIAGRHDLNVCNAEDLTLAQKQFLAAYLKSLPDCLIPRPASIPRLYKAHGDDVLRMTEALIEEWQPSRISNFPIFRVRDYVLSHAEGRARKEGLPEQIYLEMATLIAHGSGALERAWHWVGAFQNLEEPEVLWDFFATVNVSDQFRSQILSGVIRAHIHRGEPHGLSVALAQEGVTSSMKVDALLQAFFKPELLEVIAPEGIDIHKEYADGRGLLHRAAYWQEIPPDVFRKLLEAGLDANTRDDSGNTPLFFMYQQPIFGYGEATDVFLKKVDILLEHGAHLFPPEGSDSSLLELALEQEIRRPGYGENIYIEPLLSAGFRFEKHASLNSPVLIKAVRQYAEHAIPLLVQAGAPLDAVDEQGRTALMHALKTNQANAALVLLRLGADMSLKDAKGFPVCSYLQVDSLSPLPGEAFLLRRALSCDTAKPLPRLWHKNTEPCGFDAVVFSAMRDGRSAVYGFDGGRGEIKSLTALFAEPISRARVDRTSGHIAFTSGNNLYVSHCETDEVASISYRVFPIGWFPEGKALLINDPARRRLCILYGDGSSSCPIHNPLNSSSLALSSDGKVVLTDFSAHRPVFYFIEEERFDNLFDYSSSKHYEFLAFTGLAGEVSGWLNEFQGEHKFFIANIKNGGKRFIAERDKRFTVYAWLPDASALLYLDREPDRQVMRRLDRTTGDDFRVDLPFDNIMDVSH